MNIFDISYSEYSGSGLGDCCLYYPASSTTYCGVNLTGSDCTNAGGKIVTDSNGNPATGIYSCNVGFGLNQSDCTKVYPGSNFIPVNKFNQYVSSELCVLKSSPKGSFCGGCSNGGITVNQSIDLCQLASQAWNKISSSSLNMFTQDCN
jgi:hypothetical protein